MNRRSTICASTGAYQRVLGHQLGAACVSMLNVSPHQARRLAEAIGQRAKTDVIDAAKLARFGALQALQTRPVVSQTLWTMEELLVVRRGLAKHYRAIATRCDRRVAKLAPRRQARLSPDLKKHCESVS